MEGVSQRIEAERNQHNIILTVFASVCKRTYRNDKLILLVSALNRRRLGSRRSAAGRSGRIMAGRDKRGIQK